MNRSEYYNNIEVLYEIVKLARGRELSFLGEYKVRNIKAHCLDFLKSNFKRWNFFDDRMNFYYSLAHLKNMPVFSYALPVRAKQSKEFALGFNDYVTDIDFSIDMDAHDVSYEVCLEETKRLKECFDSFNLSYSLRFSGSGFHFNIDGLYFASKNGGGPSIKIDIYKRIAYELSVVLGLSSLDLAIYDERRIWKMPYSFDCKSGLICLPLTDLQFNEFNKDMALPENVIKMGVRNRGLCERPGSTENVDKFMKEWIND